MNFDDTPQEAAFRAEAKAWIGANAPREFEAELSKASLGRIKLKKHDIVEVAKAWQKKKSDGGWVCLHWPKEYGGRGATPVERVIWQQEEGVYFKLTSPFQIGEGMCGPTLMAYGSEADKKRYLPKIASGEEIWCQLFSEPSGGSDVAGLRTRAEAAGKFQAMLLRAPGTRVEGGTDEIMRNIIAERVLGLPGDIRVDKDVPFNQIPTKGRA